VRSVVHAVRARAGQGDERGTGPHVGTRQHEILDTRSRMIAGLRRAEQLAEGHRRYRQRGHHCAPPGRTAIETAPSSSGTGGTRVSVGTASSIDVGTVSGGSVSASGGTASSRNAPLMMFENTGAATSPP